MLFRSLKQCENKKVLDVCTGSGCIVISIQQLGIAKKADAIDISPAALMMAERNKVLHGADVTFIQSDMFERVEEKYDIIISNPPYIPSDVVDGLMPEVKDNEPRIALDGTKDGLKFYRILAKEAIQHFESHGTLYLEIGCEQAKAVCQLLSENGYYNIKVIKDYANLDRVIVAEIDKCMI